MKHPILFAVFFAASVAIPVLVDAVEPGSPAAEVSITVAGQAAKTRAEVKSELVRAEAAGQVPGYSYSAELYPRDNFTADNINVRLPKTTPEAPAMAMAY